jgi:hypothetical protein
VSGGDHEVSGGHGPSAELSSTPLATAAEMLTATTAVALLKRMAPALLCPLLRSRHSTRSERQSQALGLRRADTDLDMGTLTVWRGLHGTDRAEVGLARLEAAPCRRRGPRRPAARRPAHRSDTAAVRGRPPPRGHGGPRPRTDADDYGHLQPCHARARSGRSGGAWARRCGTDAAPLWLQWPPRRHQKRIRPLSQRENGLIIGVELRGLEPLTPTLPGRHDRVLGGSLSFCIGRDLRVWTSGNARVRPRTA